MSFNSTPNKLGLILKAMRDSERDSAVRVTNMPEVQKDPYQE